MELSQNTLDVLKNFSGINQNLLIKEGNTIKTISEAKNVVATAHVAEEFPQTLGIYDLNEFIGVLGLVDNPNLKFTDSSVLVGDASGRSQVRYFFSPEETLTSPTKDINMPSSEVKFTLDNETMGKIKRAASTLGHNELSVTQSDGVLRLSVLDTTNSTSNSYVIDMEGEFAEGAVFNFILSISNLKMISGDYEVSISSKLISEFKNKDMNVSYWVALEKSSTFGA
jgi:hypothetical protein